MRPYPTLATLALALLAVLPAVAAPTWLTDLDEAKKPWYMKKRRNMKKTEESAWYDIPKSKKSRSSKKKK